MEGLRHPPFAAAICLVLWLTPSGEAKSIFDDENWLPPAAKKELPPAAATQPVNPPVPSAATTAATTAPAREPTPVPEPARVSEPAPPPAERPPAAVVPAPAVSAAGPPAARRAIPPATELAQSRRLLAQVYAREMADRSPPARRKLAVKLMRAAQDAKAVPPDQYALLMAASVAAREGVDLPACFEAIDVIVDGFEVDPVSAKSGAVLALSGHAASPAGDLESCRAALNLIDPLLAEGEFATAGRMISTLRSYAVSDPGTLERLQAKGRLVDQFRNEEAIASRSRDRLKTAPDDPAANLALGRYACVVRGDWPGALPLLARGGNPPVRAAAAADLALPADPARRAALADQWWDAAAKEPTTPLKHVLRERAAYWYEAARADLGGLRKTQAEQRLVEFRETDAAAIASLRIPPVPVAATERVTASAGWTQTAPTVTRGNCYRLTAKGEWTDSRGQTCGPEGFCPAESYLPLGPPSGSKDEHKDEWYLGQHPRGGLLARVAGDKTEFFAGGDRTFVAPASGLLEFRMNDGDQDSPTRTGAVRISRIQVQPKWVDAQGSVQILARIDELDVLHVTPAGIFWEWGGKAWRVGEHEGRYPTVVNGIFWWPTWIDKQRAQPLDAPDLRLHGHLRLVRSDARRGEVKLGAETPDDVEVRFQDKGIGSSQVGCVLQFVK